MNKILLGTTNQGKVKEMKSYLDGLDVNLLSLNDLKKDIKEPGEPHDTIEENVLLKARYYANESGLTTISDDGGLFVEAFSGWPGVRSARVADNSKERREVILDMLKEKDTDNRSASFRSVLCLYDPQQRTSFLNMGITKGKITTKPEKNPEAGFGYDPIFYVNKAEKTYAAMSREKKNKISHRGKALSGIVDFINNFYN